MLGISTTVQKNLADLAFHQYLENKNNWEGLSEDELRICQELRNRSLESQRKQLTPSFERLVFARRQQAIPS